LEYLGCKFEVFEDVYKPSDDSFLILDNLEIEKGSLVLEIGTGCGIISIISVKMGAYVISLDISPYAIRCAKYNSILNNVENNISFLIGDLFSPIKKLQIFDYIIFNPPYLPDDKPPVGFIERAWTGGQKGNEIIIRFLNEAINYINKNTKILLIISSLSKPIEIFKKIRELQLKYVIKKEEKFFFEKIMLLEIRKNDDF